jgi:hypothetical protein
MQRSIKSKFSSAVRFSTSPLLKIGYLSRRPTESEKPFSTLAKMSSFSSSPAVMKK